MTDLASFIESCRSREFFERGAALVVTRAPGRLDVMGGIADYSGSLVLQRPIAEATFAALQRTDLPALGDHERRPEAGPALLSMSLLHPASR